MDNTYKADFSKSCRICLKIKSDMFQLNTELINRLYESVGIKILEANNLPNSICKECIGNINAAFTLKQLCIYSEQILNNVTIKTEKFENDCEDNKNLADENSIVEDIVKTEPTEPKIETVDNTILVNNEAMTLVKDDSELSGVMKNVKSENDTAEPLTNVTETVCETNDTSNKPYTCSQCGQKFSRKQYMTRHISRIHDGIKTARSHVCTQCGKGFYSRGELESHQFHHLGQKPFKCKLCRKEFRWASCLRIHLKRHPKNSDGTFVVIKEDETEDSIDPSSTICNECGKEFNNRRSFKRHKIIHIPKDQRLHYCSICDRKYFREDSFLKHQKLFHGPNSQPIKPSVCDTCGKSVMCLKAHIRRVHSNVKPHKCPQCEERYLYPYHLNLHIHRVHKGVKMDKPFLCNECGKRFHLKTALDAHLIHHLGRNPFKCTVCGKEFRWIGGLRGHMKLHDYNREFNYKCTECNKKFFRAQELVLHKRVHTGERPYSCEICQKSFGSNSTLRKHMKMHKKIEDLGERPYLCKICQKSFTRAGAFTNHMKSHSRKIKT